jgi:hypothetical protein
MPHQGDDLVIHVSQWLKERRADIAQKAAQQGLPMSVVVQVPVATFTETGMQSSTEQRSQSLFSAIGSMVHPMTYAAIAKPFIDGAGERLAAEMVQRFGEGVKYPCNFGPYIVQQELEHPDLITMLAGPELDPANPATHMLGWETIFYTLMILRQCLQEYLALVPSLDADDEILAQRLAHEAVIFASDEQVTHVGRIPLAGIDVESPGFEVGDCTFSHLSDDELGFLFQRRHSQMFQPSRVASGLPGTMYAETWLQERVVMEVRSRHPKKEVFYSLAPRCQKLLLAFHLTGVEFAGAGFGAMLREPRWIWSSGQSFHPFLMPKRPSQSLVTITEDDVRAAQPFADLIPDGAVSAPTSPMELSIRRYGLALARDEATEALVDYTVALEALFLGGTEMGEARRRFALNGAVYASEDHVERRRLYEELSNIYRARSVMVHGVSPSERRAKKAHADINSIRDQACEIARISLRKALGSGWPNEDAFLGALLDDETGNPE